jgi:hypothetical protein
MTSEFTTSLNLAIIEFERHNRCKGGGNVDLSGSQSVLVYKWTACKQRGTEAVVKQLTGEFSMNLFRY